MLTDGNDLLIQQHQLFNERANFLDHFLYPMNIYGGFKDEKSKQLQKYSRDKVQAKFRSRQRERVALWTELKEAETLEVILETLVLVPFPHENVYISTSLSAGTLP